MAQKSKIMTSTSL